MQRGHLPLACLACLILTITACTVGPTYQRPEIHVPSAYKESPPASFKAADGWKVAQPQDAVVRGTWWEMFNDPQLNALEAQIDISNQNVAAAEAQFRQARALVREARAGFFPTVTLGLGVTNARTPALTSGVPARTTTSYSLPIDASWELDVWGRIRRTVESNQANAQASAADLEIVRLSLQAALAQAYFQLRTYDAQRELLERTVAAY